MPNPADYDGIIKKAKDLIQSETTNPIPGKFRAMTGEVQDDTIIKFVLNRYNLSALNKLCLDKGFTVRSMRNNMKRLCTTEGNGERAKTVCSRLWTKQLSDMEKLPCLDKSKEAMINQKNGLDQFLLCQALYGHAGDDGKVPELIEHQACFTFGLKYPRYVEAVNLVQSVMGPDFLDTSDYPRNHLYDYVVMHLRNNIVEWAKYRKQNSIMHLEDVNPIPTEEYPPATSTSAFNEAVAVADAKGVCVAIEGVSKATAPAVQSGGYGQQDQQPAVAPSGSPQAPAPAPVSVGAAPSSTGSAEYMGQSHAGDVCGTGTGVREATAPAVQSGGYGQQDEQPAVAPSGNPQAPAPAPVSGGAAPSSTGSAEYMGQSHAGDVCGTGTGVREATAPAVQSGGYGQQDEQPAVAPSGSPQAPAPAPVSGGAAPSSTGSAEYMGQSHAGDVCGMGTGVREAVDSASSAAKMIQSHRARMGGSGSGAQKATAPAVQSGGYGLQDQLLRWRIGTANLPNTTENCDSILAANKQSVSATCSGKRTSQREKSSGVYQSSSPKKSKRLAQKQQVAASGHIRNHEEQLEWELDQESVLIVMHKGSTKTLQEFVESMCAQPDNLSYPLCLESLEPSDDEEGIPIVMDRDNTEKQSNAITVDDVIAESVSQKQVKNTPKGDGTKTNNPNTRAASAKKPKSGVEKVPISPPIDAANQNALPLDTNWRNHPRNNDFEKEFVLDFMKTNRHLPLKNVAAFHNLPIELIDQWSTE